MDDTASEFPQPPQQPSKPPHDVELQPPADGTRHPPGGSAPQPSLIFGRTLDQAMSSYFAQWSYWLLPTCLSLILGVATLCCCCMAPFVFGPLACGLFGCAFLALDGRRVGAGSLQRGWRHVVTASFAGLLLLLLNLAPVVLLMVAQFAVMALVTGFENVGQPNGRPAQQPLAILIIFPLQLVGLCTQAVWTIWFGTRTMFVLPAIADRGYSLSTALDLSWEATRLRFWEFFFLNMIAILLGMIGMYLCYVGIVLTAPLYFLIIAAAYDARVGYERS